MAEVLAPVKSEGSVFTFGKAEKRLITDPIGDNNPITVQILGVCSALAVTTLVTKALVMGIAVTLVTAFSNLFTAMLRNYIPKSIRMIVQLVIIAFLVTVVELVLKAVNYPIWKDLSVFIGLIITNCILMGRLEAFAMANKPWKSFLDGIGNGIGYSIILIIIAVVRELFGKGSLMDYKILGPTSEYALNTTEISWLSWYAPNNLLILSPAAMFIVAIIIWIQRSRNPKLVDIS
ncbi:MAG: NADH:ubiquinone reductase (Na(+)-transporting) subunit D [Saprospiraceae bacterium]|nr:NADH:ubiquinone reductase (Na(+)-transporting) subunit D [Saprospiraceae bacterium]MBK6566044.1 NADH:ubiquinone reductase (Na(+)-transporting) subunit D [Saprospiraceae bacterium]MBK6784314.1 NADH:ubiquinone reductase (Na(+)-transporting) subunit D [Saprospiraceae bacterium]MBK7525781.1 NADH:ubiquinone reductase (Na(+)-transporting) subunit D [Saprospiraceae bacterium]MBK8369938.1 NADH:ubiquinone reductase (Na(+)-transporting) subunit D [Saprospiraceae bacterium]